MANLSFDFNKVKHTFFNVTLKDGRKLVVKMPKKKTFEKLTALQDMDTDQMSIDDAMDTFGGLCSETLSNNMTNERVTLEYMVDEYDIEEMSAFVDSYMDFVNGASNNPN